MRVSVLVWGSQPKDAWPDEIGNHSSEYLAKHQDRAVQSLLDYVKANNLDGIDMDDETWREKNSLTGGSNRELVTSFFRKLTNDLKAARADYQVFWDAPPVINPKDKFGQSWPDFKAISAMVDGFCIMSYTMNPPTIGWTGGKQPVSGGGKVTGHPRDYTHLYQRLPGSHRRAKRETAAGDRYRSGGQRVADQVGPAAGAHRRRPGH